jgi:hypothetical protein
MIQDLAHFDNAKVNAALDALNWDFFKDKENCDSVIIWGGCAALVHLLKDRLKKAMKNVPACDRVTKLKELAELTTLHKTLGVIINLTYTSEISKVGIATVGGVEGAVKAIRTFPKCQTPQERACGTLCNLAGCSIGKAKAIESGGIEVLLAAINNHLGIASPCQHSYRALYNIGDGLGFASPAHQGSHYAYRALYNFVDGSKENTGPRTKRGRADEAVQGDRWNCTKCDTSNDDM